MDTTLQARYLAAKRALFDKAYQDLNEKQREAVYTTEGPLLILAGAGSGKTTVLVRRMTHIIKFGQAYRSDAVPADLTEAHVADLEQAVNLTRAEVEAILPEFIESPCPPYRMLAITFTNKAAGEIKTRLASQFSDATIAQDIWSGTFHAICLRILRRYGDRIGYDHNFTIYDTEDQKKVVSAVMKQLGIDEKQFQVKSVLTAIGWEKDRLHTPEDTANAAANAAGTDYRAGKIAAIYKAYTAQLAHSNAMDFDDIIMQTVRLLRENPDILAFYQRKFLYVCIDEYQDTNPAQFELAALLSGGTGNLMVVGDDDQSIYKFRGATIENILGFDTHFKNATVIKLEQNYRSTKTILDAANRVIAHNKGRRGKTLWTAGKEGEKIVLRKTEDQLGESRSIVDTIHRLMTAPVADGTGSAVSSRHYRDFAVLYRTNSQSSSVERALAKSGIPYRMLGGTRFHDRKEIRDAMAYLQLIYNHSDRERLLRIINEPRRKIGEKTLTAISIIAGEQGCTLFEVMDHAGEYPALARSALALSDFASLIHELTRLSESVSLPDLLDAVMVKSGYMRMLLEAGESERERIENINELRSNLMEYTQKNENPTLAGFLEETALVADVDKYDETADAVVLMTVHSAKGLEFPIVFLPGMEDGIFPGMQNIMGRPEDMEEERRLAYVALTRAKERVYILHAKSRIWFGQTVYNPVSRFVEEIPDELIEKQDLTAQSGGSAALSSDFRSTFADRPRTPRTPRYTDRLTVGQHPHTPDAGARTAVNNLQPGDRVFHVTFGEGEILSSRPMGSDVLLEVAFDKVGTKKLMGTYAKLKKLD